MISFASAWFLWMSVFPNKIGLLGQSRYFGSQRKEFHGISAGFGVQSRQNGSVVLRLPFLGTDKFYRQRNSMQDTVECVHAGLEYYALRHVPWSVREELSCDR